MSSISGKTLKLHPIYSNSQKISQEDCLCFHHFSTRMAPVGCHDVPMFLICMLLLFLQVLRDVARPKMMKKDFF